jgi:predicted DNA-binding transcriptional regulator AlpA
MVPDGRRTPQIRLHQRRVALTGYSESSLTKLRVTGDGPPFFYLGRGKVAYWVDDIERWLESRPRVTSTSEYRAMQRKPA